MNHINRKKCVMSKWNYEIPIWCLIHYDVHLLTYFTLLFCLSYLHYFISLLLYVCTLCSVIFIHSPDDWPRSPASPRLLLPWPLEHSRLHCGQRCSGGLCLHVSHLLPRQPYGNYLENLLGCTDHSCVCQSHTRHIKSIWRLSIRRGRCKWFVSVDQIWSVGSQMLWKSSIPWLNCERERESSWQALYRKQLLIFLSARPLPELCEERLKAIRYASTVTLALCFSRSPSFPLLV